MFFLLTADKDACYCKTLVNDFELQLVFSIDYTLTDIIDFLLTKSIIFLVQAIFLLVLFSNKSDIFYSMDQNRH